MRELFTVFMKNIKIKSLRTYSWMLPKTEIRDTEKYSKGVFAKSKIKKDELDANIRKKEFWVNGQEMLEMGFATGKIGG